MVLGALVTRKGVAEVGRSSPLLFVYVVYVFVCIYTHTCVQGPGVTLGVLYHSAPCFLRTGFSLSLKLTDLAVLTSRPANPGISMSPLSQLGLQMRTAMLSCFPFFLLHVDVGIQTQVLLFAWQALYKLSYVFC